MAALLPFLRKLSESRSQGIRPKWSNSYIEISTDFTGSGSEHKTTASSKQDWPNSKDDYELKKVIGEGARSVVHSAYCKPLQEKCAIKRIKLDNWNRDLDALLSNIKLLTSYNHKNVVKYYTGFMVQEEELWLVMRLLEGRSLLDIIKQKMKTTNCKHGVFDEATIATVLKEVLIGLQYIQSKENMYRDMKAANILIAEDGTVQIAHLGVSAWLVPSRGRPKMEDMYESTPYWMAPEVFKTTKKEEHGSSPAADIWSFGITAIEIATGTAPYEKYPPKEAVKLILGGNAPTLHTVAKEHKTLFKYSTTFSNMLGDCLNKNPSKRLTASTLRTHPFFKQARDCKYLKQSLVAIGPSLETRVQKRAKDGQHRGGQFKRQRLED